MPDCVRHRRQYTESTLGSKLFDLNATEQIGTNSPGWFLRQPERAAQACNPSCGVNRRDVAAASTHFHTELQRIKDRSISLFSSVCSLLLRCRLQSSVSSYGHTRLWGFSVNVELDECTQQMPPTVFKTAIKFIIN